MYLKISEDMKNVRRRREIEEHIQSQKVAIGSFLCEKNIDVNDDEIHVG